MATNNFRLCLRKLKRKKKTKKNLTVIPSLVLFRRLRETSRLAALDTDLIRFNSPDVLVYDLNSR